jgi:Prealbumin-like fold domain
MRRFGRTRLTDGGTTTGGHRKRRGRTTLGLSLFVMSILVGVGLLLAVPIGAAVLNNAEGGSPTIASDLPDYNPGGTVTLSGSGWDSGGAQVHIVVNDDVGQTWQHVVDVAPDSNGDVTDVFQLPNYFVAQYSVQATQQTASGTLTATSSFTDANPSADLDQCANDPDPSPNTDGCSASASDWVNGNIGASKAVYFEGDSLPYRMRFDNLSLASHSVTIEWDTTKSGKHALDYIDTYNQTVGTANPSLGVSPCGSPTTFPIPADPQVTGAGVTPIAGNLTLYGGTITSVSSYSYPDGSGFAGDKSARITINFTASQANPVLAWAGHISSRADWGLNNSAVAISGSPYHTRLINLDGAGGNQDRSLSADAVIFPGSITVIKDATPNGPTSFSFTGSPAPLSNFSLVDDGTSANTQVFGNIKNFQTYTVNETPIPSGWAFDAISCSVTSPNGGSFSTSSTTTTIDMHEGENYTCTYTNHQQPGTLIVKKHVVNDNGGTKNAGDFTLHVKNGGSDVSGSPAAGSESGTSYTLDAGSYVVSENAPPSGYTQTGISGDCDSSGNVTVVPGQTKTCTITNDDIAPKLHLRKVVINDNGGTKTVADFNLNADGSGSNDLTGTSPVDSGAGLQTDTWALSESGPAGYSASAWNCVGGNQNGANISVGIGGEATCTITNNDQAAHLKLVKQVINDNGGTAVAADFTLSASGPTPLSGAGGAESDVNAGSYDLSETNVAGYSASAWSCVGGSQNNASVTLALGESATCTITNNDQTAHLKLVKQVINDNGGTALAADFTLSASGPTPISGPGGAESDVNAGSYNLSETNVAGYSASSWSCVGGSQNNASVTLALGQSATCTITNNDIAPKLHLRKVVINDNGGTKTVADFNLNADGSGSNDLTGTSPVDSGAGLKADTWALSESGPAGYSASAWNCVGGNQNGANISVGIGGEATCTITNDDIAPKLHLRKVVINDNGGTKTVADFTLTANGTGSNDISGTSPVDSGAGLKADTWALSETNVYGYSASAWNCVGGNQNGANISVGIGGEATCTITNDDQPGTIIIKKITKPANTGSFAFSTTGAGYNGFTIPGGGQNSQTLNASTYTVTESTQLGWILTGIGQDPADPNNPLACGVTGSGGSSGTGDLNAMKATIVLKNGDTVTCVFENTGQGTTRTQGFWATHSPLANIAWFGGTAFGHTFPGVASVLGNTTLDPCGRNIDTLAKLMGGFWADVSKTTTGAKRSALDQARMQLLQQLLAAELNTSAFGSVPSGGLSVFATWEAAYCGTNQTAIKNAQQAAASFNTQGDNSTFTPGTSADSKNARAIADLVFWNTLP